MEVKIEFGPNFYLLLNSRKSLDVSLVSCTWLFADQIALILTGLLEYESASNSPFLANSF